MNEARRFLVLAALACCALVGALGTTGAIAGKKLKTKTATVAVPDGATDTVGATCKRGTKAVSGGFRTEHGDPSFFEVYGSAAAGGRTWVSTARQLFDLGDLATYAYCRDQKLTRVTESVPTAGDFVSLRATCEKGKAISGGFEVTDGVHILLSSSRLVDRRTWEVRALDFGEEGELTAQVTCRKGKGLKTAQSSDDGGVGELEASCERRKQRVVSGGFAHSDPEQYLYPFASFKDGKRTWHLSGDGTADVTVYAYCEKK